ncbi:hypothetical protein GOD44_28105 [Sinorhizobium medicae]|nr:hypothetical protein [Sinorhizobium medicae]
MLSLEEVKAAIVFDQPKLRAAQNGQKIQIEGTYLLFEKDVVVAPDGPIAEFDIRMELSDLYPRREPKVFEVGGRIPRNPDRHINPDGDCCVTVWENWLVAARDHSFGSFLSGPLNEYFLGQFWFEKTGKWPFGERAHGTPGLEEAYADALGIANKRKGLLYHLRLLSHDWPKGHWPCPCGSGTLLRHCHRDYLMAMHQRVPSNVARRMLLRLNPDKQEMSSGGF